MATNPNPQHHIDQIIILTHRLSVLNEKYHDAVMVKIGAQDDYEIAFAAKIGELREERVPSAILISMAKGDERIAALRHTLDCAKAKANEIKMSMDTIHAEIEGHRSILCWLREEKNQP